MTDADHVWTHISSDQAAGRACVVCGRATDEPGWSGVVIGRSDSGSRVYACSGGDGGSGDRGSGSPGSGGPGTARPGDQRPAGRNCAEQVAFVVPDSPEGLEL